MEINDEAKIDQTLSLSQRVFRGGLWVLILRGTRRAFELTRTLILARFLAPEDFGLMGIALLTLQAMEAFSQTGFQAALVQKREGINEYLDVAWTLLVSRGIVLFLLVFVTGPWVAMFFKSPKASLVIQALCFSFLFQGFTNIGTIYFQKELDFKRQFYLDGTGFLCDFIICISFLFFFKNVWVLVGGKIGGEIGRLMVSYVIHPYRPGFRFKIREIKELYRFGRWITLLNVLGYAVTQVDSIFLGRVLGTTALGFYRIATNIGNLPATEITHAISQVTFPAYSKLQDNTSKLREGFLRTLYLTGIAAFLLSTLISVLIRNFTAIVLGEKWLQIVPIVYVLVYAGLIRSIQGVTGPVFLAIGKPKIETICQIVRIFVLVVVIYPLSRMYGIIGTSLSVLVSIFATALASYTLANKILHFQFTRLVEALATPLLASFGTIALMSFLKRYIPGDQIIGLFVWLAITTTSYAAIVIAIDSVFKNNSVLLIVKDIYKNRRL